MAIHIITAVIRLAASIMTPSGRLVLLVLAWHVNSQNPTGTAWLFRGTVAENIACGRGASLDNIVAPPTLADADEFIAKIPPRL